MPIGRINGSEVELKPTKTPFFTENNSTLINSNQEFFLKFFVFLNLELRNAEADTAVLMEY